MSGYAHVHFGWSAGNLLGSRGLGPTGTSFADSDYQTLRTWHDRLEPVLDPDFRPLRGVPDTVCYHTFPDGGAALLHRWPGRADGDGRDATAWALLGRAAPGDLGVSEALLLSCRRWWRTRQATPDGWGLPWLPPLSEGEDLPAWTRGLDRAAGTLDWLVPVVAAVLRAPDRPLSVRLAPRDATLTGEAALPLLLLWGAYRTLHPVVVPGGGAGRAGGWRWSFSSYEPADTARRGLCPQVAFCPPDTGTADDATLVDPLRPTRDVHRDIAHRLAAELWELGGDGLAAELAKVFDDLPADARHETRVAALTRWAGVSAEATPRANRPAPGITVPGFAAWEAPLREVEPPVPTEPAPPERATPPGADEPVGPPVGADPAGADRADTDVPTCRDLDPDWFPEAGGAFSDTPGTSPNRPPGPYRPPDRRAPRVWSGPCRDDQDRDRLGGGDRLTMWLLLVLAVVFLAAAVVAVAVTASVVLG